MRGYTMHRTARWMFTFMMVLTLLTLAIAPTHAAADFCYCYSDLTKIKADDLKAGTTSTTYSDCLPSGDACRALVPDLQKSYPTALYITCNDLKYEEAACAQKKTEWVKAAAVTQNAQKSFEKGFSFTGSLVPSCLFETNISAQCRDVGVFIQLLINWGDTSFAILGTFALAFFIYGGFTLIISRGNPENIKKGTDIMLAAVIGIAVAFVGYIFIKALGETVGVKDKYNLT